LPFLSFILSRPPLLIHRVSKNGAKLFLSELLQISTNFDDFWQKDGKEAKIMRGCSFSTSANLHHHITVLNADVPNCYIMLKAVSIRLLRIASSIQ